MNIKPNDCDFLLLGRSLPHTLSPQIHSLLFEITGKAGKYGLLECEKEELDSAYSVLKSKTGYNVTIPYKCDIMPYLDKLDETAQLCGAVNCVSNKDGIATGYNTDMLGFEKSLKANGISLDGRVLLLGYGGVGRMIAVSALRAGAKLTVADLTVPDISEACSRLYKSADACTIENIGGSYDLCINASPVGMYPKVKGCPVSEDIIKKCGAVFDVIYNPEETVFLKTAKKHGIKAVGGLEMLVIQAAQSHTFWYGATFTDEQIAEITAKVRGLI